MLTWRWDCNRKEVTSPRMGQLSTDLKQPVIVRKSPRCPAPLAQCLCTLASAWTYSSRYPSVSFSPIFAKCQHRRQTSKIESQPPYLPSFWPLDLINYCLIIHLLIDWYIYASSLLKSRDHMRFLFFLPFVFMRAYNGAPRVFVKLMNCYYAFVVYKASFYPLGH